MLRNSVLGPAMREQRLHSGKEATHSHVSQPQNVVRIARKGGIAMTRFMILRTVTC